MKIRYKKVEIRMQQGASILQLEVPEWELPVLQAIHPEITELKDTVHDRVPVPSVSGEMSRLIAAYGAEREEGGITGVAYAEAVYGSHGAGLAALKLVMQGAVLPASTPVTPPELSPSIRQDLLQAISETSGETSDLLGEVADEDGLTEAA